MIYHQFGTKHFSGTSKRYDIAVNKCMESLDRFIRTHGCKDEFGKPSFEITFNSFYDGNKKEYSVTALFYGNYSSIELTNSD